MDVNNSTVKVLGGSEEHGGENIHCPKEYLNDCKGNAVGIWMLKSLMMRAQKEMR